MSAALVISPSLADGLNYCCIHEEGSSRNIATLRTADPYLHLFLAAPELLEALQGMLKRDKYPQGTIGWIWQEDARKAIAKATGATA